ncbi:MAG: hypothetical protein A2Y97_02240 [Nitrospirae bacterium RBG_13_39_12]|nr:MAG: hypothetical protein A2Y97_02240 [Nitrospirae bacterium RBG_13_39_12]
MKKEFTISELLILLVVIPACRESFLKTKKDSGQAGMTDNEHPKNEISFCNVWVNIQDILNLIARVMLYLLIYGIAIAWK